MPEPQRLPKTLRRRAANPPCATCSHLRSTHGVDRNGRSMCFSAACGCYGYVAGPA